MNRLRVERARRRITQFRLALVSGLSQTRISMIENGLVEPSEEEKTALADALGVAVERVFGLRRRASRGR